MFNNECKKNGKHLCVETYHAIEVYLDIINILTSWVT